MSTEAVRDRLKRIQSIGGGLLSHATLALKALDELDAQPAEPEPVPMPSPDPLPGPEPVPMPSPDLRRVGKVNLTSDGQALADVDAEHVGFVTCTGASLRRFRAGSLVISSAQDVTIEDGDVVGRLGADGLHITSDRSPKVARVAVRRVRIGNPRVVETSHYDGIQIRGADDVELEDVVVDLGPHRPQYTAALFIQDAQGGTRRFVARGSTFLGGGYTLYLSGEDVLLEDCIVDNGEYGLLYPSTTADLAAHVTLRNVRNLAGELLHLAGTPGHWRLTT